MIVEMDCSLLAGPRWGGYLEEEDGGGIFHGVVEQLHGRSLSSHDKVARLPKLTPPRKSTLHGRSRSRHYEVARLKRRQKSIAAERDRENSSKQNL